MTSRNLGGILKQNVLLITMWNIFAERFYQKKTLIVVGLWLRVVGNLVKVAVLWGARHNSTTRHGPNITDISHQIVVRFDSQPRDVLLQLATLGKCSGLFIARKNVNKLHRSAENSVDMRLRVSLFFLSTVSGEVSSSGRQDALTSRYAKPTSGHIILQGGP